MDIVDLSKDIYIITPETVEKVLVIDFVKKQVITENGTFGLGSVSFATDI